MLLIIDEIFMMGCRKLLRLDSILKKVFSSSKPFGGLHILLVGDFGQIPAIRQISIIDSMVKSTQMYTEHSELTMKIEALFGLFKKYELKGFHRSKGCKALRKLLAKFRDYQRTEPTLSEKDIRKIGLLTEEVLKKDPSFKDAPILVTTRKERDIINRRAGRNWPRKHGVPMFWWFQRPSRTTADSFEADQMTEIMS